MEELTRKLVELSDDGLISPVLIRYEHTVEQLKRFNPNQPQEWYEEKALKILREDKK